MQRKNVFLKCLILLFTAIALAAMCMLNYSAQRMNVQLTQPQNTEAEAEEEFYSQPRDSAASENAVQADNPASEVKAEPARTAVELVYTKQTYDIVTDIVVYFRQNPDAPEIDTLLETLSELDSGLGSFWTELIDYWRSLNAMELNYNELPDNLPQDDSLCLVTLGYRLEPDGSMSYELIERCKAALKNAEKYPRSYIVVTGGGTAAGSNNTEADLMAKWLIENGIDEQRIIIENRSMTTADNAVFTLELLRNYPQIEKIAIITSNYHIPEGLLMFYTQGLLNSYRGGYNAPLPISHACVDLGSVNYGGISEQSRDVWMLTDPHY